MDEFRTQKGNGHPAYLFEAKDENVRTKSITHSASTHGAKNQPLHSNPNPKDDSKAYFLPGIRTKKESALKKHKKYKDWKLSEQDKKQYIMSNYSK